MADIISQALFTAALKSGNPEIDDEKAAQIWQETNNKTDLSVVTPEQGAQIAYRIAQQTATSGPPAAAPVQQTQPRPAPQAAPQDLRAPAVNLPQSLMTPQQEAQQSKMLDQTQASLTKENPYDPDALRAAYAKYAENYANRDRTLSNTVAGSVAGSSGGQSVTANQAYWQNEDERNKFQTTGMQKALQDQYKEGLDANSKMIDIAEKTNKFKIDASESALKQKRMQAELIPILQNADVATQMADPNSSYSLNARLQARTALLIARDQSGKPLYSPDQIKQLVPETSTGLSLAPVLATMNSSLASVKSAAENEKLGAEAKAQYASAAASYAQANASNAQAGKTKEETRSAKLSADLLGVATQGGKVVPSGMNMSIGPNGAVLSPDQQTLTEQTGAGNARLDAAKQFQNYETLAKPEIDNALKMLSQTYTGKGASALSSYLPGNEQAAVASALMRAYQSYPESLPPAIAENIKKQMAQPGWTGAPKLALTVAQNMQILQDAKAGVERNKEYRARADAFQQQQGGKPADFYRQPSANVSETVILKKGNRTIRVPASEAAAARADGWN